MGDSPQTRITAEEKCISPCLDMWINPYRFQHVTPVKPENQPYLHTEPAYGTKIQYAKTEDTARKLDKKEKRFIQQVVGTFSFYGRVVDNAMLTA